MKNVFIINANPKSNSICKVMAEQYAAEAKKNHNVELVHIGDMRFDMDLTEGYDEEMPLEADLKQFQEKISWAEHLVIISPVWWGSIPAKFKGVIDRTFLPGFAFKYEEGKLFPRKLLSGKTSQLIVTLDTPTFWYKWVQGNPIYKQLNKPILEFAGIKNKSANYFGPIINSKEESRKKWIDKVGKLALSI